MIKPEDEIESWYVVPQELGDHNDPYVCKLYMALLSFCHNGKVYCYPSRDKLMAKSFMGLTKMKTTMRELVKTGFLKVLSTGRNNRYVLKIVGRERRFLEWVTFDPPEQGEDDGS